MSFTDVIKRRMAQEGLKPSDLARQTGYSQQYISDLLRGRRRWNETTMEKVCRVLGIKVEFGVDGLNTGTEGM